MIRGWYLEDPNQPHAVPPRSRIPPFMVGLLVGVTLVIISLLGFQLFSKSDPGVTVQSVPVTVDATVPVTSAPATASTTTPSTTTTLPAPTSLPEIQAVGVTLPIADLPLTNTGIGPINFGDPALDALGKLVASLGLPSEDTGLITATGEYGACLGDPARAVRWGPLVAVVILDGTGAEVFAGYRLSLAYGGLEERAAAISTLSGLRAGDTVTTMEAIYSSFHIAYLEMEDIGLGFELRRAEGDVLLLRGPVTSAEESGRVTGIFSPDACGNV